MRKLKLDLETLAVESFHTGSERNRAGTVHGYVTLAAQGCNTDMSCQGTCGGNTCWDTCGGCPSYYCVDTDYGSCGVDTCAASCGVCDPTVNDQNTCIAPCTYTC